MINNKKETTFFGIVSKLQKFNSFTSRFILYAEELFLFARRLFISSMGLKKQLFSSLVLLIVSRLNILKRVREICNFKIRLARHFVGLKIYRNLSSVNNKISANVSFSHNKSDLKITSIAPMNKE